MATVLLVEDNPLIAMTAADMLTNIGHQVIEASSGERALDILASDQRIDLIMTDHLLPGINGLELARDARKLFPDLPILLATGYNEIPEAQELGAHYLFKPYSEEQLAAEVGKLLAGL
jgi:CheY-like chemotaxis protein